MPKTTTTCADQFAVRGYIHDMLQALLVMAESRGLDDVATGLRCALAIYPTDLNSED